MSAKPFPVHATDTPPPPAPKTSFWRKLGGGSLTVSILMHAILLAIGVIWIFQVLPDKPAPDVDFMPKGGGGGTPGAKAETNQKKRASMTSLNTPRLAAKGATSSFVLPEPDPSSATMSVGAISSAMAGGLGGSGSGGGRGSGNGTGFGSGNGPGMGGNAPGMKPFSGMMFGKPVKAKTIGVVLDVSGSMGPHLPRVVKELDRVAEGSPLILYYGCGIEAGKPETRSYPTIGDIEPKRFERYWRATNDPAYRSQMFKDGSAKIKVDFNEPMPSESLYKIFSTRPNTYFIEFQGAQFSYTALLAKELRDVEAVYWFSDFEDPVDDKEAKSVMYRLKGKKQKLYIHPSIENGHSLSKIRELMVVPTDGEVIDAK